MSRDFDTPHSFSLTNLDLMLFESVIVFFYSAGSMTPQNLTQWCTFEYLREIEHIFNDIWKCSRGFRVMKNRGWKISWHCPFNSFYWTHQHKTSWVRKSWGGVPQINDFVIGFDEGCIGGPGLPALYCTFHLPYTLTIHCVTHIHIAKYNKTTQNIPIFSSRWKPNYDYKVEKLHSSPAFL